MLRLKLVGIITYCWRGGYYLGSTLLGTSAEPTDDHGDWGEGMERSPVCPTGARGSWVDFVQIFKKPSSHVASHQEWCNKEAGTQLTGPYKIFAPGGHTDLWGETFSPKTSSKGVGRPGIGPVDAETE